KKVLIADQMGLGKTLEAIGITTHLGLYPWLAVVPAIVRLNWQREILASVFEINPKKIAIIKGRTPYPLPGAEIFIINYDILPWWVSSLQKLNLKAIIFDEIHYAKNGSSKRGKASRILAKDCEYV